MDKWIDARKERPKKGQLVAVFTPARPLDIRVGRYQHYDGRKPAVASGTTGVEWRWVVYWMPLTDPWEQMQMEED